MFASASNTSLFGFGSTNLEGPGVPRVASLEMLRSIVDQESEKLQSRKSLDTGAQAQRAQEQPLASPTSLQQPQVLNTQLFQPSGQAISNAAPTLSQSMILRASAMHTFLQRSTYSWRESPVQASLGAPP